MDSFLQSWSEAAYTTVGFFWMALWAFILGYALSSIIQVFVTKERMKSAMGDTNAKSVGLGTFFGFISSSCSFSALATTKSLFQKGAGFMPAMAFLLASTNLVIELGIVISLFLGWQFVVGEYIGGFLLILFSWILIKLIKPKQLIQKARERLDEQTGHHHHEEQKGLFDPERWNAVGKKYVMEWKMVWKDVSLGFTIAGIVAVFVPNTVFESLFINSGLGETYSFAELLQHSLVGPLAAFITFIGSMGNIPLAALLFGKGVSFAGVMAFIFSDLVVFPVLRINANYYGWKMSFFILFLLFASLIFSSLALHYGFAFLDLLPDAGKARDIMERDFFQIDYSFYLNIAFLIISGWLIYLSYQASSEHHHEMASKSKWMERILKLLAIASYFWLAIGLGLRFFLF